MAMLHEQGVHLRSPSNTPSPVGGRKSCCASVSDAVDYGHLDLPSPDLDIVDLLTEPTPCTLVVNPGGYQFEVARGVVYLAQSGLLSQPVLDGYAVVRVDYVNLDHTERVLSPPPSDEVRTLGEAVYKKIQWRRGHLVVSPKGVAISSPKSSRPPLPSAKRNLLEGPQSEKAKTASKSASVNKAKSASSVSKEPLAANKLAKSVPQAAKSDKQQQQGSGQ